MVGSNVSAEIEEQLSKIPDEIGDEPGELEAGEPSLGPDEISALMDSVAFEEQDIKDILAELFEWLDEYFQSDHWKLTDRQVRMLGRPTAQLMNSLWGKLKTRIPDILANWCESTPGATAFLMAFGLVVIPKGLKQFKLSKERAKSGPKPTEQQRMAPRKFTERPSGSAASVDMIGVPAAAGIVGEMRS